MTEAIQSIHAIQPPLSVHPAQAPAIHLHKMQPVTDRYVDTLESLKEIERERESRPQLEPTLSTHAGSPGEIFAKMMDNVQEYVKSTSTTAELKHDQVGRKIRTQENALRKLQHETLEAKQSQETWNTRHMIANCVLNGVTTLTGVGLTMAGNPWTGGSLIVSGVGNTASELMRYYNWNSTLTAATSIVSGLVGLVGGLGSGVVGLARNPALFARQLTSGTMSTVLQAAGMVTSLISNGVSGYAMVERSKTDAILANLDAAQTQADSSLRLLQQKYGSATMGFQGTVKSFSGLFKTITKTHNRYTRDCMRVLTAEYPA